MMLFDTLGPKDPFRKFEARFVAQQIREFICNNGNAPARQQGESLRRSITRSDRAEARKGLLRCPIHVRRGDGTGSSFPTATACCVGRPRWMRRVSATVTTLRRRSHAANHQKADTLLVDGSAACAEARPGRSRDPRCYEVGSASLAGNAVW